MRDFEIFEIALLKIELKDCKIERFCKLHICTNHMQQWHCHRLSSSVHGSLMVTGDHSYSVAAPTTYPAHLRQFSGNT